MKQLLLHGPAINSSRKKLSEIRSKFDPNNVVVFDNDADIEKIKAALMTESLFNGEKLIILENPAENIIYNLSLVTSHLSLVMWFDHEIDTKNWKDAEVLFFPEAKEISVFPFLDYLGNKDQKAFLELYKLKKAGFDFQYLNTMFLYLLRNLVATPKGAKDFVKNKNARMRKNFSGGELVNLYYFILKTDFKIKSGLLETAQAEFLLVNLFLD